MEKTAKGLVEYAKAQLGRPYWYGTFGQAASKSLYNEKKRQYPHYYKWDYANEGEKVHDCCGLIKGYLWCDGPNDIIPAYNEVQDISANQMRTACTKTGTIDTIPDVPGVLVFYNGHVGVYIGGGEVIEARGHVYGVIKTKLNKRSWTSWGYCPFITYEQVTTVVLPVLCKGMKSDTVKRMQCLLISHGDDMEGHGADGSFGGATRRAIEKFQTEHGLAVTGVCDAATWAKLLGV